MKFDTMKKAHLLFLFFRYVTLTCVGLALAFLWKTCQLADHEPWGQFYALWLPLLYGLISTGYIVVVECRMTWGSADVPKQEFLQNFEQFLRYDDYTYLLLLWAFGFAIAGAYLKDVQLWFAVLYLTLIGLKGGIFLVYLYHSITCCGTPSTEATAPDISTDNDDPAIEASRPTSPPTWIRYSLLLTAFCVYAFISAYHIQRASTTGDEPHYLLITHSLWQDHDTNLHNNYENNDYTAFYWHELLPTWGDRVSETEVYSYRHKGGFPYVLLPGYVLGGRLGATLQMNLTAAVLMLLVFLFAYEQFHSLKAAFFTWGCMAFTLPIIVYMGQIYPETVAALLLMISVRAIYQPAPAVRWKRFAVWRHYLAILLPMFGLVLLKTRYLPIAGALFLLGFFQLLRKRVHVRHTLRVVGAALLVCAAGIGAIVLADRFVFDGMFWERLKDLNYMTWMLSGYNPLWGFFGMLFDQEYGLFPYAPVYILAIAGLGCFRKQEFRTLYPALLVFALNYCVLILWPLWHAAPTPPSRYLLPILPLLGICMTAFFRHKRGTISGLALGMFGFWSLCAAWIITLNPWWRYNWADGSNNFLEMIGFRVAINLVKILPSWIRLSPWTPYMTGIAIVLIAALIYVCRCESRQTPHNGRQLSADYQILIMSAAFIAGFLLLFLVGKGLPTRTLEAEDSLDMVAQGGERVPAHPDPWGSQLYLRRWNDYGWKLYPGDALTARPKLYSAFSGPRFGQETDRQFTILARMEPDHNQPEDIPIMRVLLDKKEIVRIPVDSTEWRAYSVIAATDQRRPELVILHEKAEQSRRALIIDKIQLH